MNDEQICIELEQFLDPRLSVPSTIVASVIDTINGDYIWKHRTVDTDVFVSTLLVSMDQVDMMSAKTAPHLTYLLPTLFGIDLKTCSEKEFTVENDGTWKIRPEGGGNRISVSPEEIGRRISEQTSKCSLSYFRLLISTEIQGHANMLFVHSNKEAITIALYEPHGYDAVEVNILDALLPVFKAVKKQTGKKVKFLDIFTVSCARGLQSVAMDQKGYCYSFSLLWLYIILKTMQTQVNLKRISEHFENRDDVVLILSHTERAILKCKQVRKNPRVLMTIVRNFAITLFNRYMEYIYIHYPHEARTFTDDLILGVSIKLKNALRTDPQYFYEYQPIEFETDEKEMQTRLETGVEKSKRKKDYSACEKDEDCLSDNCIEGKCNPFEY